MGLMKSAEKFKPQAGCRFATYAYWWIRQTIRKAIFQRPRAVHLPAVENMYTLLGKVLEAKRSYVQEGNHYPTTELSRLLGVSIERYLRVLSQLCSAGLTLTYSMPHIIKKNDPSLSGLSISGVSAAAMISKVITDHKEESLSTK
ncbi:RNA polymerase sigma-70 region 2 [Dillenia turbinata]|uniref:RNA polymerase sigma-70 region 2 n=1 Tax=Dillenia turbinata TaxID=194707 RepID=A0AAN8WA63_9MAGN